VIYRRIDFDRAGGLVGLCVRRSRNAAVSVRNALLGRASDELECSAMSEEGSVAGELRADIDDAGGRNAMQGSWSACVRAFLARSAEARIVEPNRYSRDFVLIPHGAAVRFQEAATAWGWE
jgi:hypothetical protein